MDKSTYGMSKMEKSWRPKDWKNPYIGQFCVEGAGATCEIEAFEEGADTMLKAIREKLGEMAFLLDEN